MGQSISVNFIRPVTAGHAEVRARARHRGRTTWVWDAEVLERRGKPLRARADDDRGQASPEDLAPIPVDLTRSGAATPTIGAQPPKRFVIGSRRSRPKARGVMRIPGAAWRRLYSERSTMRITSSTIVGRQPGRDHLLAALVALDVGLEDAVEQVVGGQRVAVELVGAQLGRGRALDHRGGDQLAPGALVAASRPARRRASSARP